MSNSLRNTLIVLLIIFGAGYYAYQNNFKAIGEFFKSDSFNSIGEQISKSVIAALDETESDTAGDTLNQKLNAYVEILNYVSDSVRSSYNRYGQWCDLDKGPTNNEQNIYGLYKLNDQSRYFEEADRVSKLEPKIALDDVYIKYAQKYQTLKPLADKAYKYYDQKDYQDDQMAEGKAMHSALVAAFDDFLLTADELSAEYEKIDVVQRQKELKAFQDADRQVAYNATNVLVEGQNIYFFVREELFKKENKVEKLSAENLKTKIDIFEKTLNELTQVAKDKVGEVKDEYGITGDSLMDSYISAGSDYLKSMKSFYRSLRDKKFIERNTFSEHSDGTPENLIYTYNTMVDKYNFMNKF